MPTLNDKDGVERRSGLVPLGVVVVEPGIKPVTTGF
jgi:hypothetical protein